ncbi:hypothetical protein [Halalkalibacter sp. APA_J-10(15)]|uniref:hypothetical protein n=1 Tax=Halalkalibacter sp. APA_J-10(15) TaxID=2933805 RepID=UPI001FF5CF25|nr:hypothetical protein [Halalkalibacter sp. APA_J-10(15)]MCK0473368.1 hypothetical protein [Halalkalibacter sp. APA_J-10(15)]
MRRNVARLTDWELSKRSVGEAVKKEDRDANRTGSESSKKEWQESHTSSNGVGWPRRLYVKNVYLYTQMCELKKQEKAP